jgi:hypothetical protein
VIATELQVGYMLYLTSGKFVRSFAHLYSRVVAICHAPFGQDALSKLVTKVTRNWTPSGVQVVPPTTDEPC